MLMYTTFGCLSVVCQTNVPLDGSPLRGKRTFTKDTLQIRAWRREHLERLLAKYPDLLKGATIVDTPNRDYTCRILLSRERWTALAAKLCDIDYPSYKGAVGHDDPDYYEWVVEQWRQGRREKAKKSYGRKS